MPRKNLLIGITGSIAAKKTPDLIDLLKEQFNIKCIITFEGTNYIDKNYFKDIDTFYTWEEGRTKSTHIDLSRWADEFIIYPATSNIISKIVNGSGEDLLTTTILMYKGRLKIFPAMHEEMNNNNFHNDNLETIQVSHHVYGPEYGKLDAGDSGLGRLIEPENAFQILTVKNKEKVFIISGPTKEYIDDVRFITNSSSGKQGYALAIESTARGFDTTYISSVKPSQNTGFNYINFENTADLLSILNKITLTEGYLFMPAAISDFIPDRSNGKIDRREGERELKLSPNIDIIKTITNNNPKLVAIGFSAQLNMKEDRMKLDEKNLDYLIINDISNKETGFGSDFNKVLIINKKGKVKSIETSNKFVIAKKIMNYVFE